MLGRFAHKDAAATRAALLSMFGRIRCAALSIAARAVVIVALQVCRCNALAPCVATRWRRALQRGGAVRCNAVARCGALLQRLQMDEPAARCAVELILSTHGSHLAYALAHTRARARTHVPMHTHTQSHARVRASGACAHTHTHMLGRGSAAPAPAGFRMT